MIKHSLVATGTASHMITLSSYPQLSNFNQSPKDCAVEVRLQLPFICTTTLPQAPLLNTLLGNGRLSWLHVTFIIGMNGATSVNQKRPLFHVYCPLIHKPCISRSPHHWVNSWAICWVACPTIQLVKLICLLKSLTVLLLLQNLERW